MTLDTRPCDFPSCNRKCRRPGNKARGEAFASKKVLSRRPPQKPFAAMSSLAPSSVIAEAPLRVSPNSGCKVGSLQASLQTSDRQPPHHVPLWVGLPCLPTKQCFTTLREPSTCPAEVHLLSEEQVHQALQRSEACN